ncbi:mapB [Symbiodinium microadriaticum]|uniref:type I methionyl aminopeptidase n=1 Tax=Pelagibius sp. TaxID=1931238 RepID=UPI001A5A3B50|nr:mapB [Symbiodinium microadriaticum]
MTVDSDDQLAALKRVGQAVRETLALMRALARPGITPRDLDEIGRSKLRDFGARPAPELAYGFPGATCISVNEAIAHGVPDDRPLKTGDLVNIDVSAEIDGYWADSGASFAIGPASPEIRKLCRTTRRALQRAIESVRAGRPLNVIARAVGKEARRAGYRVIPELAGHGVGRSIHEAPTVSNVYDPSNRQTLHEGLVITIEPFLTKGSGRIYQAEDGWTLKTVDGAPAAQFEHSLVVTRGQPVILT